MKIAAIALLVVGIALLGGTQADTARTLRDEVLELPNATSGAGISGPLESGLTLVISMETQQPLELSVYRWPLDAPGDEQRDLFFRTIVDSRFDGSIVLPNEALWDVSVANLLDTPNIVHFTVKVGDPAVKTLFLAAGLTSSFLGVATAVVYWPARVAPVERGEAGTKV